MEIKDKPIVAHDNIRPHDACVIVKGFCGEQDCFLFDPDKDYGVAEKVVSIEHISKGDIVYKSGTKIFRNAVESNMRKDVQEAIEEKRMHEKMAIGAERKIEIEVPQYRTIEIANAEKELIGRMAEYAVNNLNKIREGNMEKEEHQKAIEMQKEIMQAECAKAQAQLDKEAEDELEKAIKEKEENSPPRNTFVYEDILANGKNAEGYPRIQKHLEHLKECVHCSGCSPVQKIFSSIKYMEELEGMSRSLICMFHYVRHSGISFEDSVSHEAREDMVGAIDLALSAILNLRLSIRRAIVSCNSGEEIMDMYESHIRENK